MSQPIRVSDALIRDARLTGQVAKRSIADQIELWAKLGRAIEPLLRTEQLLALSRAGATTPLSACLKSADSPQGRRRMAEHLKTLPYPHYEAAPASPGLLIRIEADRTRTRGRFVNRRFRAVNTSG